MKLEKFFEDIKHVIFSPFTKDLKYAFRKHVTLLLAHRRRYGLSFRSFSSFLFSDFNISYELLCVYFIFYAGIYVVTVYHVI